MNLISSEDHIFIIDNVFTDDECEKIIRIIDNFSIKDEEVYKKDGNVNADSINFTGLIDNHENMDILDMIIERNNAVCEIIEKQTGVDIKIISSPHMRKIKSKTLYHIDGVSKNMRNMSFVISLNSDYEGGELHFPKQGRYIKLKRGQAIAFPPYWTHPHGTTELKNDTFRYTLNFWSWETTPNSHTN